MVEEEAMIVKVEGKVEAAAAAGRSSFLGLRHDLNCLQRLLTNP